VTVHRIAQQGFGSEASTYERSRPTYPPDAVAWLVEHLGIGAGTRLVDLAAGTGKLTRLLAPVGPDLVAVEPVEGMRTVFAELLPGTPLLAGTAEALPFRGGTVDAITVAQAFHWFDAGRTFVEFARTLRPGGRVGLVWNARDRSVPWVDAVWSVMDRVEKEAPWRDHEHWRESALGDRPGFGPVHAATFHHSQVLTHGGIVERFRGVSHVASMSPIDRDAVLAEVRSLLETRPDTREAQQLELPYLVDAYWCERE
jgi:SAM-dependent methyltransferase